MNLSVNNKFRNNKKRYNKTFVTNGSLQCTDILYLTLYNYGPY